MEQSAAACSRRTRNQARHVERAKHFSIFKVSGALKPKHRRNRPTARSSETQALGQDARQVLGNAPPVMCAMPLIQPRSSAARPFADTTMRPHERLPHRLPSSWTWLSTPSQVHRRRCDAPANTRSCANRSTAVRPHIASDDAAAVRSSAADDADDESGDVASPGA